MVPLAWMLPATVMLDEAQRERAGGSLESTQRNLALVFSMIEDTPPAVADRLRRDKQFLDLFERDMAEHFSEWSSSLVTMMTMALRLRARNLTPDVVEWTPHTINGVPGFWVQIKPEA